MMQVTDNKYLHTTRTNTRTALMPRMCARTRERCQKCVDSIHIEGFQCPVNKYQCKCCHGYGHLASLCYQKKQVSFKPRKPKAHMPKAHMLQAGAVYACDKSICSHSEDLSSSDESFACKSGHSIHKLIVRRFLQHLT